MKETTQQPLVDVLGIHIAPFDLNGALAFLSNAIAHRIKGYVCLAGVHGIMEAHRNPTLHDTFEASLLSLPDGIPTVWVGHWQGHAAMRQITGPDLMLEIIGGPHLAGCTHFLYGGKPGIAEELRDTLQQRFPRSRILGTYTPPFRDLSPLEEKQFIATINTLRPDIVWVGISTPKQERFMRRMLPHLDTTLMFGVGAAFDFHTGRIKDCPQWVKRAGLQWLDRLIQDPRHLWRRYLRNNPTFLWFIFLQLTGLKRYTPPPVITRPATGPQILQKVDSGL